MTTSTDNPIEAVRARLDGGRKWHKGAWVGPDGEKCLIAAARVDEDLTLVRVAIAEQFPDRAVLHPSGRARIPDFNDHPDTTWADVSLVLDKASIAWDEQVRP